MVFIPFIWFTSLTIYWWRKHEGIDICVYMSGLYALTSLCAVILVCFGILDQGGVLFDEMDLELNIIPTIIYVVLLTLSLLPFSMVYSKDMKTIKNESRLILDVFSWLLIFLSLLNLYLVADSTLDILGGDLEAVRQAHYEGIMTPAQLKAESMPFFLKYLYYLNTATLLALPLFFYYMCIEKSKPWWFKALMFFTSLSVPLSGIQAADRTEFMFYILMFIYCVFFFRKKITRKMKRYALIIGSPFAILITLYLVAVTQARFEEREGGVSASVLEYAGQGYLNFCYFWENQNTDEIATEREFPLINHFVYKIDSNTDRRAERGGKQGFFISVFASFIGDILLDIGFAGVSIWVIYFFLLGMIVIKAAHRPFFYIGEVLVIFLAAAVPIFGIFYYRYFSFYFTLMFLIAACIYFLTTKRISVE